MFSRGRLKISKCSISLVRLGKGSKSKVTPLLSRWINISWKSVNCYVHFRRTCSSVFFFLKGWKFQFFSCTFLLVPDSTWSYDINLTCIRRSKNVPKGFAFVSLKDPKVFHFLAEMLAQVEDFFKYFRIKGTSLFPLQWKKVEVTQPGITCSKLTIETLEQGVKYVQS